MDALRRRAEAGDAEAMSDLGATYAVGGEGLAQDLAEAMGWFLKSADAGSVLAKLNLAGCYRDGRGCDVDETKAMELYREAASSRPPDPVACDAMECLGEAYRLGECGVQVDDGEAARWFKRGAAAGSVACAYRRGVCLALGVGVAKDVQAAVAAFRNAHESGHAGASLDYGHCLMRGLGVAVDQKAATRAYAVAANKNHPDAAFHLGMAYLQGAGVPRTPGLAAKWLLHAAKAGHPEAMHEYAGLVSAGAPPGVPKNVGDAVGWYAAAADSGVAESAAALGSAHFQGIDGFVKRDLGEAEKWFEMALFLGMAEAAGALATARLEKTREAKQTQTLQAHDAAWICFLEKVSALRRVSEMDETIDEDGGGDAPCSRRLHASCVPVPDDKDVVQALKSAEENIRPVFCFGTGGATLRKSTTRTSRLKRWSGYKHGSTRSARGFQNRPRFRLPPRVLVLKNLVNRRRNRRRKLRRLENRARRVNLFRRRRDRFVNLQRSPVKFRYLRSRHHC